MIVGRFVDYRDSGHLKYEEVTLANSGLPYLRPAARAWRKNVVTSHSQPKGSTVVTRSTEYESLYRRRYGNKFFLEIKRGFPLHCVNE